MTPAERAEAIRKGEEAAAALDTVPFAQVRATIMEQWTKAEDYKVREDLWFEQQALERVKARLWAAINDAKVAAMEIAADQAIASGKVDPYVHS